MQYKVGLLRSDESFFYRTDLDHHNQPNDVTHSRLEKSIFRMVTQFLIDVIHQMDLGITKFLLYAFKSRNVPGTPTTDKCKQLDIIFKSYSKYTPREFARKPRSLNEMYNYKVTNYRQITSYTGMGLFKPFLSTTLYQNFLLLVCAYKILSGNDFWSNLLIVDNLLLKFVSKFRVIYKKVGMNIHN